MSGTVMAAEHATDFTKHSQQNFYFHITSSLLLRATFLYAIFLLHF